MVRNLAPLAADPPPPPDPGPLAFLCDPCDPMTPRALGALIAVRGTWRALGVALATAGVCAAMDYTDIQPRAAFAAILGIPMVAPRPATDRANLAHLTVS